MITKYQPKWWRQFRIPFTRWAIFIGCNRPGHYFFDVIRPR